VSGRHEPLRPAVVKRAVRAVLEGEGCAACISIAFVGPSRMRRLNQAWKGRDRPTDVLAFTLPAPGGGLAGDVYICRSVARTEAKTRAIPLGEELTRLVIHGTLHVLGYEHPDDDRRTRSAMWRRQERYLACVV
jgi:probable rRNA maturation factor